MTTLTRFTTALAALALVLGVFLPAVASAQAIGAAPGCSYIYEPPGGPWGPYTLDESYAWVDLYNAEGAVVRFQPAPAGTTVAHPDGPTVRFVKCYGPTPEEPTPTPEEPETPVTPEDPTPVPEEPETPSEPTPEEPETPVTPEDPEPEPTPIIPGTPERPFYPAPDPEDPSDPTPVPDAPETPSDPTPEPEEPLTELPRTGVDSGLLAAIGALMLGSGLILKTVAKETV